MNGRSGRAGHTLVRTLLQLAVVRRLLDEVEQGLSQRLVGDGPGCGSRMSVLRIIEGEQVGGGLPAEASSAIVTFVVDCRWKG